MPHSDDDSIFVPEDFSGRARLFPLPNLVMFPHVVQPLHVFEPRYVELFHDALAGDRLITMALLEPGWEHGYEGRPPIAPVGCLGRVLSWQEQPDERCNLLLLGLRRVRIERELAPYRSFREATVQVLEDVYTPGAAEDRRSLHAELVEAFERMLPQISDADDLFSQLSINNISLGTLTDVIGYAVDLDVRAKQALLAERNVDRRAAKLLAHMHQACGDAAEHFLSSQFPPAFSTN